MTNFWIDTTTIACASILGFLSIVDSITKVSYKNSNKYWKALLDNLKKIKVKLPIFIIVCFIGFFTNKQKYKNLELENAKAKKDYQNDFDRRDSINQTRFNASLTKSSSASATSNAETMAKYYLLYDSVQHRIERVVKDSAKKNITTQTYTDALPDFDISNISFKKNRNDTLEFIITMSCKKTAIQKLNLQSQLILMKNGKFTPCPIIRGFIPKDTYMSSNTIQAVDYMNICSIKDLDETYFHIYGYYFFKQEKYPVDFILYYSFKDSTFGIPGTKEALVKMFNQYL